MITAFAAQAQTQTTTGLISTFTDGKARVGINTATPAATFDVQGNTKLGIQGSTGTLGSLSKHTIYGNITFYPHEGDSTSKLVFKGLHTDGRWEAYGNNQKLFNVMAEGRGVGFGEGEYNFAGGNSAIGIYGGLVSIPRLAIGATVGATYSQLLIERSHPNEWKDLVSGGYVSGANFYRIATFTNGAPTNPNHRAPIKFSGYDLSFYTGGKNGGLPVDATTGALQAGAEFEVLKLHSAEGEAGKVQIFNLKPAPVGSVSLMVDANGYVYKGTAAPAGRVETSTINATEKELATANAKLKELEIRLAQLEQLLKTATPSTKEINLDGAKLEQNIANPFNNTTIIKYYVPKNTKKASIRVTNLNGVVIFERENLQVGEGELLFDAKNIASGLYLYELAVDGKVVDVKKMAIQQ